MNKNPCVCFVTWIQPNTLHLPEFAWTVPLKTYTNNKDMLNFLWIYFEILYIFLACWNEFCESKLIWLDFLIKCWLTWVHLILPWVRCVLFRQKSDSRESLWLNSAFNKLNESLLSWRDDLDMHSALHMSKIYDRPLYI